MKTTTVKLTTTHEVEKDLIIPIPYYARSEEKIEYYKVFGTGANDCIKVFNNLSEDFKEGLVNIRNQHEVKIIGDLIECTEQEWTEQFERAILYFQTINRADDL